MISVQQYKFRILILLIFFLVSAPGSSSEAIAQEVTEYAKIDSLNVGDEFRYTLTLEKDSVYDKIIFPDSSHFGSTFEIRSLERFQVTDFKDSLIYNLQFFGTADTSIPQMPVLLVSGTDTGRVYTRPIPVSFKTVLQSEEEEFRPFKPIFEFAAAWWPYLLALILLLIAAWYAYKLYMEKLEETERMPETEFTPVPFRNPLNELEKTLQQLRSYSFTSFEDYEQFYINLGDAIRLYFERLYNIPALESTSREILKALYDRSIDDELIVQTRKVLNEADMVKFARFTPSEEQAEKALRKGESFLKKAREIDGPKVNHLRRQHTAKMERKREEYEQQQKNIDNDNDKNNKELQEA